jgi:foldase protein PrsA
MNSKRKKKARQQQMWQIKKAGLLALALVLILTMLAACGKKDPIVATFGDNEKITESEYREYVDVVKAIEPSMAVAVDAGNKEALTSVLHYQIMSKHIADQVKETDEIKKEADENFAKFEEFTKQQLGQPEKMNQFYADKKVTKEEVKQFFLDQVKLISYFGKDIKEEDKKKEYEQAKKLGYLTEADVRHILISTEKRSKAEAKKKAEELVKKLRGGADFAKLATENTDDPGSKETGGLYQYNAMQPLAQTVEAYRNAAMTLPLNKISDPIETEFGYHIMRVEKRKEQTYDEVKKDITKMLAQEKEHEFYNNKLKGIIKEEKIPASMIKEQKQPAPAQPNANQKQDNK